MLPVLIPIRVSSGDFERFSAMTRSLRIFSALSHPHGRAARALGVIRQILRGPEKGDDCIPFVLVHRSVKVQDDVAHDRQVFVQEPYQLGRIENLGNGREPFHVAEYRGHLSFFATEFQLLGVGKEVTDDAGRDISREGAAHLTLFPLGPKELDGCQADESQKRRADRGDGPQVDSCLPENEHQDSGDHQHDYGAHHDGARRGQPEDREGCGGGNDGGEDQSEPPGHLAEELALDDGVRHGGMEAHVRVDAGKRGHPEIRRGRCGNSDDAERAGEAAGEETANVHDILVHVARLGEEIHHLRPGLFGVLPLVRSDALLRQLPVDVFKDLVLCGAVQEPSRGVKEC